MSFSSFSFKNLQICHVELSLANIEHSVHWLFKHSGEFLCISEPVNNVALIRECKSNRDWAGQDLSEGGADSWPVVSE